MVKYKNLEGRFENHIRSSVEFALQSIDKITDEKLRNCIKKRLEKNGTIRIRRTPKEDDEKADSDDCYTDPTRGGYNNVRGFLTREFNSKEITLCIENLERNELLNELSDYILHEFAHSCGWEHGEGKGVPFQHGLNLES